MDVKAGFDLNKCKEKKCTEIHEKSKEKSQEINIKIKKELVKFSQNKITNEQFLKNMKTLVDKYFKSPEMKALAKCSIEQCGDELKEAFESMSKMLDELCKKQNKKCDKAKENKIILKKPMTVDSFTKFMKNML